MIRTIILLSVSILLVFACNQKDNSAPPKDDTALAMYKYNDSLQCDLTFDTQGSISEMRLELVNKGIDVIDNTCGNDGLNHPAACGEDTGNINVFYIHPQNLDDAVTLGYGKLEDLEHAKLFNCLQKNENPPTTVDIYKYDGSVQCDATFDKKKSIDTMFSDLANADIDVFEQSCGNDGLPYDVVCGGSTGNINIFNIDAQKLDEAKTLGFDELQNLNKAQRIDCQQDVPKPAQVDIYKHDGSLQCDESFDKQGSINTMLNELTNANIDVFETSCGNDGFNYAAVCGGGTGNINIFSIDTQKMADAKALGYDELQYLENPTFHSCPPL